MTISDQMDTNYNNFDARRQCTPWPGGNGVPALRMCSGTIDRPSLKASVTPRHSTLTFKPWFVWNVLVLITLQSGSVDGADLDSPALVMDVAVDENLLSKVKWEMFKVIWDRGRIMDMQQHMNFRAIAVRGMLYLVLVVFLCNGTGV